MLTPYFKASSFWGNCTRILDYYILHSKCTILINSPIEFCEIYFDDHSISNPFMLLLSDISDKTMLKYRVIYYAVYDIAYKRIHAIQDIFNFLKEGELID